MIANVLQLWNVILRKYKTYIMNTDKEIKDVLECIARYDDTDTLENKGKYFEVIQKDAQRLVKLFSIDVVSGSLDLQELDRRLDEALDSETSESLVSWLSAQRQ